MPHPGKEIRKQRILAGYTQQALATAIGKTRALVSHIEKTGKVNSYTLKDIEAAIGKLSLQHHDPYPLKDSLTIANEPEASFTHRDNTGVLLNEIAHLKEIIFYQKKVIALLEAK